MSPRGLMSLRRTSSVVALVEAVAVGVVTGRRSLTWRAWPPFGLLLAALAVTTVTSQDALTSATGFVRYAELFVLIPVAVAAAVRDRIDVLLVAGTVIAVASLEGAIERLAVPDGDRRARSAARGSARSERSAPST